MIPHIFKPYPLGANVYLEWGKPDQCIADCDQAIKINKDFPKVSTRADLAAN